MLLKAWPAALDWAASEVLERGFFRGRKPKYMSAELERKVGKEAILAEALALLATE